MLATVRERRRPALLGFEFFGDEFLGFEFFATMARGAKNKLGDGWPLRHSNRTKMSRFNRTASRTEARELKRLLHPDRLEAPPRPRCNKTAAASKKRAAGRTWVCRQPELLAAASNPAVPVLWSRQLRRSQESFTNEKPFATRKFDPFLDQLPEVSSLNHTWHGGCDHCDTCAVVGASGSLLNREHGALIDANIANPNPNPSPNPNPNPHPHPNPNPSLRQDDGER